MKLDELKQELTEQGVPDEEMEKYIAQANEDGLLEEEKPEDTPAEPEQPDGDTPPKEGEEVEPEPEKEVPEEQKTVPLAALHEERMKRQERDRQLQQLQQKLQELEQKVNQPPQEEEEQDPLKVMVNETVQETLRPYMEAQRQKAILDNAEEQARNKYADNDDVTNPVMDYLKAGALNRDPNALQQYNMIVHSPNPAEMMYHIGRSFKYEQMTRAQQQAAQQAQVQQKAQQAEKLSIPDQLPRGTQVGGGSANAATVLSLKNYESWPAEVKNAIMNGRQPAGYKIVE